ncbi:AcrR family transcriptional regulator [Bradyrhizobium liaoningense]
MIKAALREAEQGGAEAISIKALARQLGVSQPAPYRHFVDREALLAAVTAEAFRQLTAVSARGDGGAVEAVEALATRASDARFRSAP